TENWAAMLLLMRVYAEDLSRPEQALAVLQPPPQPKRSKQPPPPQLPPAFVKYARRSIDEWGREAAKRKAREQQVEPVLTEASPVKETAKEVSINDFLQNGQLTTAIEYLEKATSEQPQYFEAWLKLAEVNAVYCGDMNRAGKIIRKIELNPA